MSGMELSFLVGAVFTPGVVAHVTTPIAAKVNFSMI